MICRDVEQADIDLAFNADTFRWERDEREHTATELDRSLASRITMLIHACTQMTTKALTEAVGPDPRPVSRVVQQLLSIGKLKRERKVGREQSYSLARTPVDTDVEETSP